MRTFARIGLDGPYLSIQNHLNLIYLEEDSDASLCRALKAGKVMLLLVSIYIYVISIGLALIH